MGEQFLKLKRKFLTAAIVKSAVIGAACGLFAVGAVLLALKLSTVSIAAGYYVLIAVAAALVAGGVAFSIFMPTDIKTAKKLDSEYGLNERAQTALAYSNSSGGLFDIQREDTQSVLGSLKLKKPTFKTMWQYVLIGVLSLALFVTAAVIPARTAASGGRPHTPPPTWEELPFEVSRVQIARVAGLIENVESFNLSDSLKLDITEALGVLVTGLQTAKSNGDMQNAVLSAVRGIDGYCKAQASYYKIASSLKNLGCPGLARVIATGAETYRAHTFNDDKSVKDFYNERFNIADEGISRQLELFGAEIGKAFLGEHDNANGIISSIHLAIILSNVSGDDKLYLVINDLTLVLDELLPDDLYAMTEEVGEDGQEEPLTPEQAALVAKINAAIAAFGYDLADILAEQAFVFAVDKFVYSAIFDILGLDEALSAGVSIGWNLADQIVGEDDGNGKDEDNNNSGGYGGGDVEYGSDDLIFDPDTGEYVPYGQLINKYYAIVNEMLLSGQLSEEQASIIRAYFEMLLSGIKDKS